MPSSAQRHGELPGYFNTAKCLLSISSIVQLGPICNGENPQSITSPAVPTHPLKATSVHEPMQEWELGVCHLFSVGFWTSGTLQSRAVLADPAPLESIRYALASPGRL